MLALSGTAAGAQRAQIRPTRVKEGGSDTAKRCFRGPHELAFIRSKIFIYPQFASSHKCSRPAGAQAAAGAGARAKRAPPDRGSQKGEQKSRNAA